MYTHCIFEVVFHSDAQPLSCSWDLIFSNVSFQWTWYYWKVTALWSLFLTDGSYGCFYPECVFCLVLFCFVLFFLVRELFNTGTWLQSLSTAMVNEEWWRRAIMLSDQSALLHCSGGCKGLSIYILGWIVHLFIFFTEAFNDPPFKGSSWDKKT